jgi:hypothetical protein
MNSKQPHVQVRSHTRAAPKNGGQGNSNTFGVDLREPPTPDGRIVEQDRSSWPNRGRAPQSDRLPSAPGTDDEALLSGGGARNEPPEPAPLPSATGTFYNTSQGAPRHRSTVAAGSRVGDCPPMSRYNQKKHELELRRLERRRKKAACKEEKRLCRTITPTANPVPLTANL